MHRICDQKHLDTYHELKEPGTASTETLGTYQ